MPTLSKRALRAALPLAVASCVAAGPRLAGSPTVRAAGPEPEPAAVVRAREAAFAKTMADRDLDAFASFISEEAVFVSGAGPLRGRREVVDGWKRYFEGPKAPFSWAPDRVEVVASGTLALSSGPVMGPDGQRVGTFVSTWRRDPDGEWRIVLDIGCPRCNNP
jgi:ketosteroid isomerase-like protein